MLFPTFHGRVSEGQLVIDELEGQMRMLEGKSIAVSSMTTNSNGQLASGELVAGEIRDGQLVANGERTLGDLEGSEVMVVVRHELIPRGSDAFDMKYQLGQKIGDIDK